MSDRIAELREFVDESDSGTTLELPYSSAVELLEEIDGLGGDYADMTGPN